MRTFYVNGDFVAEDKATISVLDRGFLFSDSVYEVCLVLEGKLIDHIGHLQRLETSLIQLDIAMPASIDEIINIQQQLIEKNNLTNGAVYLQVTRGVDIDRDFLFNPDIKPSLILFTQSKDLSNNPAFDKGIKVITVPEIRWAKRDIKTTGLLGAVLAKKTAKENAADDAWFIEDGFVTEGSSNNVFIIKGKTIITKKPNKQILNGITRRAIMKIADEKGMVIEERNFTVDEAKLADEVFSTSATALVMPVISVDKKTIGNGNPGAITTDIRKAYIEIALAS